MPAHFPTGCCFLLVAVVACGRIGYHILDENEPPTGGTTTGPGPVGPATGAGGSNGSGLTDGGVSGGGVGAGGTTVTSGGGSQEAGGSGGSGGTTCRSDAFNGHAYVFCDGAATFDAARSDCRNRGMLLVRIDDAAEDTWVHSMIPAADQADDKSSVWRWLGANDIVTADDWRWDDGSAFWSGGANGSPVNGAYANWGRGQPIRSNNACVLMEAKLGYWLNLDCPSAHPYVCEQY
jgi:hypothetical protein